MQWLDDADDVVFALVQMLERLRWPCLELAFVAACTLAIARAADVLGGWVPLLLWVTLGALALWTAGLMVRVTPRRTDRPVSPFTSPNA